MYSLASQLEYVLAVTARNALILRTITYIPVLLIPPNFEVYLLSACG